MKSARKILLKSLAAVIIAFTAAILIILLTDFSFLCPLFNQFECDLRDLRSQYRASYLERKPEGIVIIDIDNRSIEKLGKLSDWDRRYYAEVTDFLHQGGAKAVVFDIIFDRGSDSAADSAFAESASNAGIVYFALTFSDPDSDCFRYAMEKEPEDFTARDSVYQLPLADNLNFPKKKCLDNLFFDFINGSRGAGFTNCSPDRDGVVRSAHLLLAFNGKLYPSLPFSAILKSMSVPQDGIGISENNELEIYGESGDSLRIPLNAKGKLLIDYYGTFKTFRYISFYDVFKQRIPAEYFRDKIVFIGASAPGLFDLKTAPVQRNFPGVEIHATIATNILEGDFLKIIDSGMALVLLILFCMVASFSGAYLRTWQSITLLVLISLGYVLSSFQIFASKGVFTEIIRPESGMFLAFLGAVIYRYMAEEKDKRFLRHAFSHFVDKHIIREILEDPAKLKLGGERREITILFSDIRDFTSMSEQMEPEQLSAFLNKYLTVMTNIVLKHGGLLDKYIGDALVALFGAPVRQDNHAERGAATAIEMMEAVEQIRRQFAGSAMENLRIGIGLNTGVVSVGNMGSDFHFEYTAIGDEMNLGSRLEGLTKFYGANIILSGATAGRLGVDFALRKLDKVQVKGRNEPVEIYELRGEKDSPFGELSNHYQRGLEAYANGDWESAEINFRNALKVDSEDKASRLMLERMAHFRENPPGDSWEGIWVFEKK